MSLRVYAARLASEPLRHLIDACRDRAPFAVLDRPDRVDFPVSSEPVDFKEATAGWMFGDSLELHWKQDGGEHQVRLALADDAPAPPGFAAVFSFDGPEPDPTWYYLWGEEETAIGGRLKYSQAIPGPGRGQIAVVEYRDSRGRLLFYRYAGLTREAGHA